MLKGIGVSSGIVIGKAYVIGKDSIQVVKRRIKNTETEKEIRRFKNAVSYSKTQLLEVKKRAEHGVASEHLFIIDTHLMILKDEVLVNDIITSIKEKEITAEWAIKNFLERFTRLFEKIGDEYLKGKKTDIEHIAMRIINNLTDHQRENLSDLSEPVIIIADDITPSDTLQMNKKKVMGFATNIGGRTSHTAILAAALGIPAVVGLKNITARISHNDSVILDGTAGIVIVRPGKDAFKKYLKKQQKYKYYEKELIKFKNLPSETKDGFKIKIMANIGRSAEVMSALNSGAEGVGLYRTEYLFMNKKRLPGEEELFSDYKKVAQSLKPMPAIIRTMDMCGEDLSHRIKSSREKNPVLGLRAIRLSLNNLKIFRTQLKGILRASHYGNLKIMFPMISGADELSRAKEVLEDVKNELKKNGISFDEKIKIGIMIETPSAAIIADILAKEVDFFSIGTNDLIQYSLAIDRDNEEVSYLYQPFHPAILRLIHGIVSAANRENIEIGVCGEMGSDPQSILILLGLGKIDLLSMDTHAIPRIKRFIQMISIQRARNIARDALSITSAKEVKDFTNSYIMSNFPDEF